MLAPLLWSLPWLAVMAAVVIRVRLPAALPPVAASGSTGAAGGAAPALPSATVIIPARNEGHNIERVVSSVTASDHPDFEVVVVDDGSDDGTGDLARALPAGNARRLRVLEGEELPEGWMGKPWACWQGYRRAMGDVLLFTDADTIHHPELLGRAVAELGRSGAGALSLVGVQLMESFWERLIQPQIFMAMLFRFPDMGRSLPPERWRDAVANGQYLLFRRDTYEALGGHERVKGAVVEDLRFAQILVEEGYGLAMRRAEKHLATRMYRSLAELVAGWSKNIIRGGIQTLPPALRPWMPITSMAATAALWLAPALVLFGTAGVHAWGAVAGGEPWAVAAATSTGALLTWSGAVVAASALFWMAVSYRFGAPARYGPLYPLGALMTVYIMGRAWHRMGRVEWKGRRYAVGMPE